VDVLDAALFAEHGQPRGAHLCGGVRGRGPRRLILRPSAAVAGVAGLPGAAEDLPVRLRGSPLAYVRIQGTRKGALPPAGAGLPNDALRR
jgi:hypothetical protein